MTETCAPNSCWWDMDTAKAKCLEEPETVGALMPGAPAIAFESNPGCLPTFRIGASCGSDGALEGRMRCDDTCSNVVRDRQPA